MMGDKSEAIRTENLSRIFGTNTAVDRLNLTVEKGELFGLVGPDGAGKTTLLRLLTAILDPSSGNAWVGGRSILDEGEEIKEHIGYMSQRFGLYEDLTVMENILFYADLYDVPKKERPPRIERLLGFSNLTPFKDRRAGNLSGGMKQKLGLACTLVHTPEILFLDEPTNGVDPVSRRDFWRILYDLLREGITTIISTSYLDEAERCTRVALFDKGRLLLVEKPDAMRRSFPYPMLEIWCDDSRRAGEITKRLEGVKNVSVYGDRIHVSLDREERGDAVVTALRNESIRVLDQRAAMPSIEDIFISTIGQEQ
ncbi:export ABC transporter ATP-binding protein [Syntrophus aciditrophicus SB]|uniref:Export ABC transporter ATP-binding protein n=2 Tax=Syntrophus TaxID=43773 RepID=Q2LXA6_SYNAS|nr:export ABC transporter ATP-binding protein [Syntrophus aciditrophicus SB]